MKNKNTLFWFFKGRSHKNRKTNAKNIHYYTYRKLALSIIKNRTEYWANVMHLQYNSITIRNQKTRWGSCSCKKNLNFNYRLIFLPVHLLDYIVIHELCHLKEMNHSKKFWLCVQELVPDYKNCIKEVRFYEKCKNIEKFGFLEENKKDLNQTKQV